MLYLRDLPSGSHSSLQEYLLISPWGLAALEQVDFTPLSTNGEGGFRASCYALIRPSVPCNLGAALLGRLMPCLQKPVRNPHLLHTQPRVELDVEGGSAHWSALLRSPCYVMNICTPQNSYVNSFNPEAMVPSGPLVVGLIRS